MFKVGDLVRYKNSCVDNDSVGLVVRQNTVFKQFWIIKWINGSEYQENGMFLEVVKN
tara:strand:- start:598 stop:768 length:171 start_codon:yes stop_codon:yes gene_type:complete